MALMPHTGPWFEFEQTSAPGGNRSFRSVRKWCSRQLQFHCILNRRLLSDWPYGMSDGRVERRLAAILAVDVAGYSRLIGADEEGTHARLKAHLRELVN